MEGKTPAVISDLVDLLLEILLRVPAKSLIIAKSVSKQWHSLISDASFRKLHSRRHRKAQASFLLHVSSQFFHFDPTRKNFVPFNLKFDGATILQTCNSLLLVECGYPYKDYYVYNPTTGESRNLMVPKDRCLRCLFLAFDPLKSPHYKVVCLRSATLEIEVYDSERHKWEDEKVYCNMHPHVQEWVYSNSDNSIYALASEDSLICFDIEKLMFQMPLLEAEAQLDVQCIMESFGHVYRISYHDETNLMVHEVTKRNQEWSIEHLFHFDITPVCPALIPDVISILGVMRGDRNENSLVFHIPGKIMAYRSHESRFEELLDVSAQRIDEDGWWQSYPFVESLAPV
ncbi:hypothetical protein ACS0TY_033128 [Phlomoides rotata]